MFSVVACVKPDRNQAPQDSEEITSFSMEESLIVFNNRAHFEAGTVQLEEIKFSQSEDSLETNMFDNVQLYFKICGIRDRSSQGTIRNEKFNISSELGERLIVSELKDEKYNSNPVTVNSGNCLRWSQYIPKFDFLAPSVNVALHFEIESLSGNLGRIIRRVGFNPWDMYRNNNKTKGFLDITDYDRPQWQSGQWILGDDVTKALSGEMFDSNGQIRFSSLTVEPVEREPKRSEAYNEELSRLSLEERNRRLEIDKLLIQEKQGLQINVNMAGKLFAVLGDSTGNQQNLDITRGRFKVYMNLIASGATDDHKKYQLSSNVSEITGQTTSFIWQLNDDGVLNASVPMLLKTKSEFGRVELLLKVVPVSSGLRKLKPFTAVYDLGQYDSWVRRQAPPFKFNKTHEPMDQISYDKYVAGVSGISKTTETLRAMDRFYFSPLKMRFVRIMPGESATDRTLQYSVTTCLEHGLYGSVVGRGLQFNIETEDNGKIHKMRRATNEAGCLTWFGFLSHKYYRKEVLQKKIAKVEFAGTDGDKSNEQWKSTINKYSREFPYYMNPWDEKWTFGWDSPDMPEGYADEISDQRKDAPKSQLFIADFRYETMGFRYAIDKYLDLKVKKAILLKAYPYVLKYNSIVLGRNGTEKLRDGIYLMKVALQKDYLDPSTKGVTIYDKNLEEPINRASDEMLEDYIAQQMPLTVDDGERPFIDVFGPFFDRHKKLDWNGVEINQRTANEFSGVRVNSQMTTPEPIRGDADFENESAYVERTKDKLRGLQKEYISVQTKLVRVLGGMIITPVEFEVDDLRLMRIRNQVFFQLETIDEHKLRIATSVNETMEDMWKDGDIEAKYEQIFALQDEMVKLDGESEAIQKKQNGYQTGREKQQVEEDLRQLNITRDEAEAKLNAILGLDKFEKDSEAYKERLTQIEKNLRRLKMYREEKLGSVASFRNDKRIQINRILKDIKDSRSFVEDVADIQVDENYEREWEEDPFLEFYFLDKSESSSSALQTIIEYKIKKALEEDKRKFEAEAKRNGGGQQTAEFVGDLEFLKIADFSESPLTPTFDFQLLVNAGEHDPSQAVDDGKSGLPSRTFVGPLTFVFNTNGSSLRPTDILNEGYCTTAFCEAPKMIRQGVPPTTVDGAAVLDENGNLSTHEVEGVFDMGDSVNAAYENNKYYGYLKAYHNMTVDKLIQDKFRVENETERKNREGSQIINFTRTMGLKYTLLHDNPASRLKEIDHACLWPDIGAGDDDDGGSKDQSKIPWDLDKLDSCFSDVTTGPDILHLDDFWARLNERQFDVQVDGHDFEPRYERKLKKAYYAVEGDVTEAELMSVMTHGWQNKDVTKMNPDVPRKIFHRMCFALTQKFLNQEFLDMPADPPPLFSAVADWPLTNANRAANILGKVERLCHRYVGRVYGYDQDGLFEDKEPQNESGDPVPVSYPPVILERKVRTYDTTDRYVYRGGKSLNLNLSASFNISTSRGIKISTSGSFKPWSYVKDGLGRLPFVGPVFKFFAGGFDISRSNSRDNSGGRTDGTNVSSGTFLVSQQATFDIEIGEYERCLVARLHPAFIKAAIEIINYENEKVALPPFRDGSGEDRVNDVESQGVMICSGKRIRKNLPIKEKYYYFTQHFTEGDMLDTADLHNHPWLLQLRGFRDFQMFTAMVGAREVDFVDNNEWLKDVYSRTKSDAATMASLSLDSMNGQFMENKQPELQIIDRSEINWPLDELSRTYFEVLPTFPGLYTFMDETGATDGEWPYPNPDPEDSFDREEVEP